jgi:hypothetical protein
MLLFALLTTYRSTSNSFPTSLLSDWSSGRPPERPPSRSFSLPNGDDGDDEPLVVLSPLEAKEEANSLIRKTIPRSTSQGLRSTKCRLGSRHTRQSRRCSCCFRCLKGGASLLLPSPGFDDGKWRCRTGEEGPGGEGLLEEARGIACKAGSAMAPDTLAVPSAVVGREGSAEDDDEEKEGWS